MHPSSGNGTEMAQSSLRGILGRVTDCDCLLQGAPDVTRTGSWRGSRRVLQHLYSCALVTLQFGFQDLAPGSEGDKNDAISQPSNQPDSGKQGLGPLSTPVPVHTAVKVRTGLACSLRLGPGSLKPCETELSKSLLLA